MRCPKCQYISFDSGDRCRNCGYQFSLSEDAVAPPADLPIQTGKEPEGPLADLPLGDHLPLFGDRGTSHDDKPLIDVNAAPRAPLAVRKSAPAVSRPTGSGTRPAARRHVPLAEPVLDLEPDDMPPVAASKYVEIQSEDLDGDVDQPAAAAPTGGRLLAAMIDLVIIGAIDAAVLHFTLKLCGLEYREIAILPVAPLTGFLLLLNGGYFAAFTAAGGQSIGKMIAGVRVVTTSTSGWSDRVPLGQAVLRSAGYLLSALPAGLGFLPALFSADKRAIHDRLAHTRVVKV